ncbi:DUF6223 family protein [Actinoplanes sp. GCM10030250]|uniref:DUF6223 family protein n=1 Tax=Actinoplanes sp. GCM10030250 TaxID=3273376 RepID=UPI00361F7E0D
MLLSTVAGYEVGTGRLVPSVAAVIGLISVVVGVRALLRSRRTAALLAVGAAMIAVAVGGVHAANAAGGLGTGNGLAGAVIAVLLGVIGLVTSGLALART